MKKNYFKKSISLVLTVLMLMSCWVFVPGEHQIEADAALAYGMSAVNGVSEQNKTFLDRRTSSTGDYVQIKYPGEMYMDISENLSDTGYSVNLSTSFGNGSNYKLVMFPTLWGGQQFTDEGGIFSTTALKGQTNIVDNFTNFGIQNGSLPGYFDNYNLDGAGNITVTCGDPYNNIGTSGFNAPFIGQPKAVGTYTYDMTKANGTPTTAIYLKKDSVDGQSWANDAYEDGTPTNFKIIVYDKADLNTAINTASGYTSQTSKYTTDSLNKLKTAVSEGQTVLKTRKVTQSDIDTAKNNINNAISSLVVARNYDITYENMFSLTDWMNTSSFNTADTSERRIVIENNDTLLIYKNAAGSEVTTSSSYSGNHQDSQYAMAVTGGKQYTVRYTIADNSSVSGTAQSEVFVFWYDANNNPVQSVDNGSNTFNKKGFSSKGICSVTFTAPANAAKAEIRFDNDCPSSGCTLRFKDIAVYPADRAAEVELDSWTVRPTRKVFGYHATLSGQLDIPERKGYKFNGWYIDNVNVNGKMDDGEAVTDAQGKVIKALTMDKHYNLYADWLPLPMDVGYDNIFSLAEWAKSGSVNPNNTARGTIEYDVMAGTITVTANVENDNTSNDGEIYSSYNSDGYTMAVEPNTEYVFTAKMTTPAESSMTYGQMFIFCYDADGNAAAGPVKIEDNGSEVTTTQPHIGIYPTTDGVHTIKFRTPENCYKLRIRVGATDDGAIETYSNIGVYEKAVYDAYAKDYAVVRVPFDFGDTTNLSLVPTRAGYKFDGWYTADGKKLTSVDGLKESTTVYAHWLQKFVVTFKNWDGTVLKTVEVNPGEAASAPGNPAKSPDDDHEYVFDGWNTDFSNVTSDLTVTATFTTKAHSNIVYNKITNATCTDPGRITKVCNNCNYVWNNGEPFEDTTGEFAPALGHTFEAANPTYTVIADQGTEASHTVKCNRCDATTTMAHDFKLDADHPASDATCVKAGETYYKCACLREKTETGTTNPNNHVNTELKGVVAAKCEQPGYTGDTYCNDCQKTVATGSATEALEHVFTNYVYNNDAKCGVDGTETAVCDRDGCTAEDERTKAGTALEHSFTNYVDQGDATCDKEGTEIATCDRDGCNETDSRSTGKKRDHKFDGAVKNNNDGTHSFECSYDDCAVYGGKVACSDWEENEAEGKCECTVCGYTKDHTWSKWSQATGNTGDVAGKMNRTCDVCGATDTTDCAYDEVKTPATCEDDAYTTYTCTDADCGHAYTVIHKDTATGHKFNGNFNYDADADKHQQACTNPYCYAYGIGTTKDAWADCIWTYTNKEAGKHTASCVCGNSEEQSCSGGTATCTAQAVCEFCNTAYGTTADHVLTGTEKYLKKATDATCIANETYYKYCIGCENVFSDTDTYEKPDTMTEHDYTCKDEYLYKATDAECEVNETYYAYCSNPDCKKSSEDASNTFEKDGTALEHVWVDAQYNGEETLKHTFTCERGCGETMEAACADSAITFGLEEATCTEQGYTTVQCTACNHTWNINYTDALGHDYTQKLYDEAHTKSEANCDQAKVYWYDCSRCDKNAKDETDTDKYTVLEYFSGDVRPHSFKDSVADAKYLAAEATCTAAAKYYYSCEYDDCDAKDTTRTFSHGAPLGHDFTEKIQDEAHLISSADCVNGSKYYYDCSRCNENAKNDEDKDKYTYTLDDFSGHEMTHTAAKDATCEEAGNYEYWYCSNCKIYYKDKDGNESYLGESATVIKKLNHNIVKVSFKAATCEKDGNPPYEYCTRCDYTTLPDELEDGYKAKGHNFTGAYYCDTANNYHAQYCVNSNCDMVTLTDAEGNPYEVKSFGIVVDGQQIKYSVVYDGLDFVITGGVPCDTTNYTTETSDEGIHTHANTCVCGNGTTKTYSEKETFVETVAPTCTTKGYDSYACPDCDETWKINEVPAKDHTPAEKAVSNGDGTHSIYCTVENCGYKISTSKCSGGTATCKDKAVCEICDTAYGETTGHTFEGEWAYQNDAKCGVNGTEKNTCTVCGTEETREAAGTALEHDMSEFGYTLPKGWDAPDFDEATVKAPTCGTEGLSISYCQRKDCYHYVTIIAEKTNEGHEWGDPETLGDCSSGVSIVYTCSLCGDKKTEVGDSEHKYEQILKITATCTANGYIRYQCTVCKFVEELNERTVDFTTDATEVEFCGMTVNISDLKAKGHVWGAEIVDKEATCGATGRGHKVCSVCQAEEEIEIPVIAGAHDRANYSPVPGEGNNLKKIAARAATCQLAGNEEYYECTRCSYSENADGKYTIPALAHADNDGDGICDNGCRDSMESINAKKDGCICHKENGFMKFIYSILRFFWKLFKINQTCECGVAHY